MSAGQARTALAYAAVYFGWGSTYLAIRCGIDSFPPLLMQGARFLLAGALLYAWQRARGAERPRPAHWRAAAVVGILLPACGSGGVAWAEQMVPSGLAAVLIATEPLWIVLLVWLGRGVRPSRVLLLGVGLGCAGVALLAVPGQLASGGVPPLGAVVLLWAALSWAVGTVYARGAPLHPSQPLASAMSLLVAGVVLLGAGALGGEVARLDVSRVSLASLAAFVYLVVVGSLVAYSAYLWLARVAGPVRASTYAFVNPAVALGLGWLVAGEILSARAGAAAALIVVAVVLVVVRQPSAEVASPAHGARRTPWNLRPAPSFEPIAGAVERPVTPPWRPARAPSSETCS